jgi:hypothetical protein
MLGGMQKRSTARGKADLQRRSPPNAARSGQTALALESGEVTLGGHADRGLTLRALYDTGVLERLRLEVRARLIMDLTLSLAWLHENPRLMAAYSHLTIAPSTIVIGLDGVARVDVRAAKRGSELSGSEAEYRAPELALPGATGDHRADIFSLGVLIWEALAGRRLNEQAYAPPAAPELGDAERDELPATLAGPARVERELARRRPATRGSAQASHARLRLVPPPLSLPADAEWALPLLELAVQAMNLDVGLRPQDCRAALARLVGLEGAPLASHLEIAEVVQGISAVATLCEPEPTLPSVDEPCQDPAGVGRFGAAVCAAEVACCFQPPPAPPRPLLPAYPAQQATLAAAPLPAMSDVALRRGDANPSPRAAWFWVGLLWLGTAGLLAGYVAAVLAHR